MFLFIALIADSILVTPIPVISADLIDMSSIVEAIEISEPSEVYHLAAQSYVGASFEQPISSAEINWTLSKTSSACNLQKFGVDNLREVPKTL